MNGSILPALMAGLWQNKTVVLCCTLLLFLSSCAGRVTSTISTFRVDSAIPVGASVSVHAATEITDTLEFDYYKRGLIRQLSASGFRVTDSGDADLRVSFSYDSLRRERDGHNSHTYAHGGIGYRGRFGPVIYVEDSADEFEFLRRVKVKFSDNKVDGGDSEDLLSITALSSGQCEHLVAVYDEMLIAIFSDLSRKDGSVVKVRVKNQGRCINRE